MQPVYSSLICKEQTRRGKINANIITFEETQKSITVIVLSNKLIVFVNGKNVKFKFK